MADKLNIRTYLLIGLCITFLTLVVRLSSVMVMILNRVPYLLFFYIIIKFYFNS